MENVLWDLAKALGQGMDVEVLTTTVPDRGGSFTHEGVKVSTVPHTTPGRYSPAWWIGTGTYTRAKEFDTVMSVSGGATAMIHLQRGPAYTFQAHGTAIGELKNALRVRPRLWPLKVVRFAYWTALDSFTYRRVDKVIAASEQVASFLRRWPYSGAWKNTVLEVIPNGVDDDYFSFSEARRRQSRIRFGYAEHETVAVTVSRLDVQKGVDRAIAAVKLCSPSVKLLVAGGGPENRRLKSMADERVTFLGEQDREGVRAALSAADVFVLPVRNFAREALPLSVLEAVGSGLRVIVPTKSTWPKELVPMLEFVDVDDPETLAQAIVNHGVSATSRGDRRVGGHSLDAWAACYKRAT